jgi:hypothetical protein
VLAVNLTGTMLVNRAVARHMVEQGHGSLVNLALPLPVSAGGRPLLRFEGGSLDADEGPGAGVAPYGVRVNASAGRNRHADDCRYTRG